MSDTEEPYVPLIPNEDPKRIGDIVTGHDAFTRKFIEFGEVITIEGETLVIKCPTCDHTIRKHRTLVAHLRR